MSSVGFVVAGDERELETLREAYNSLNDIIRGIESAQHSIEALNFGMARDHLKAALWHAGEAKKSIAAVGQSKTKLRFGKMSWLAHSQQSENRK